jgi:hypothetical protein
MICFCIRVAGAYENHHLLWKRQLYFLYRVHASVLTFSMAFCLNICA